ncbi:MAG: hypothetical protein AAGI53_17415 [Planctomycetota bacterium]
MSKIRNASVMIAAVGGLSVASVAQAKIVENDLTGNVQFDGWDSLGGLAGYGIGEVGPFAPPATAWPAPVGSMEAGSGDAILNRTFGTHYSASFSLYSFAGPSGFIVGDSSAISDLANVVFTIADWVGSSPSTAPVLSYNGGTQSLAADFSFSSPFGSVDFGGPIDVSARTFQWDLSGISGITDFSIAWTAGSSAGITGLQLEQSDVFSVASANVIPHPSTALVVLGAGLVARRRRA